MRIPLNLPAAIRIVGLTSALCLLNGCGGAASSSSSVVSNSSAVVVSSSSTLAASSSALITSSSLAAVSSSSSAATSSATSLSSSLSSTAPSSSVAASSSSAISSSSAASSAVAKRLTIDALSANLCAHSGADETTHTGYQGSGYYNGSNMAGAGFSVAVNVTLAGDYLFNLQYANGGTLKRNALVHTIDGQRSKKMEFAPTQGWDKWQTTSIMVSLKEGANMIALTALEDEGLANIDTITLEGEGLSQAKCPQPKQVTVPFIVGMDISSIPELRDFGVEFYDLNGQRKDMLSLLKSHGVNFIRLRTFVNPKAPAGYASMDATCPGKAEAYNDQAHTVAFAKEIKQAGFGLLLDLQYSDTWTDPGKQMIPEAWRNINSLSAMATQVRNYTRDIVSLLDKAGAKPEIVQIGNEITAGMLVDVPTSQTTCWGDFPAENGINGSAENWDNLATLLKAGINGVKDVDADIDIMLHIENTGSLSGLQWWVDNAMQRNVTFDILGLSAYEPFQGPSSNWTATMKSMASRYPQLKFSFTEYNQEITLVNTLLKQLPNNQGIGSFFWEPTQSGYWGEGIFDWNGNSATANNRFKEFDSFRQKFSLKPSE